ncbi:hypothetical protein SAMD00019534_000340 [Acytostelium subglobosum LB1]|uniref:hypothetical protein n=1 Tax=Acytostelium subglobosum LB1 TaxID=1410327 RepID=UPI000645020B|nr:hypothetical protein SAMD00019534_000340 [Acytostelium subglobosum LB1]GAM16859.1 hypothetical protein SAMD00019534_000340 [Acytostelium subglobosum LB1]|eukprot:XP_012758921.1 hypothetical protein SAMD00019534_000340 [Acytostelium subglobosum LB1]
MSTEQYVGLVRSALISQDHSGERFTYRLRQSKSLNVELTIYIKLQPSEISIKTSFVFVKSNDSQSSLRNYFEWLINKCDALGEQNKQLRSQNDKLQQQFNKSVSMIELLTKEKHDLEKDLYGKFIIILNEKKKKIRELKQQIQQQNTEMKSMRYEAASAANNPSTPSPNSKSSARKRKKKQQQQDIDSDKEQSNNNSDDSFDLSLSLGMAANPTPALDLLSNDDNDSFKVPSVIRKRYKHDTATTTVDTTTTTTTTTTSTAKTSTSSTSIPSSSLYSSATKPPPPKSPSKPNHLSRTSTTTKLPKQSTTKPKQQQLKVSGGHGDKAISASELLDEIFE